MSEDNHSSAVESAEYLAEVKRRLDAVFGGYAADTDVSPGERLRLEGFMQAGIYLQFVTRQQLVQAMQQSHQACLGLAMEELFPPTADATILPIPPRMQRAPVVPSTSD